MLGHPASLRRRPAELHGYFDDGGAVRLQGATEGYTFENELPQSAAGVFSKYSIPEASFA